MTIVRDVLDMFSLDREPSSRWAKPSVDKSNTRQWHKHAIILKAREQYRLDSSMQSAEPGYTARRGYQTISSVGRLMHAPHTTWFKAKPDDCRTPHNGLNIRPYWKQESAIIYSSMLNPVYFSTSLVQGWALVPYDVKYGNANELTT